MKAARFAIPISFIIFTVLIFTFQNCSKIQPKDLSTTASVASNGTEDSEDIIPIVNNTIPPLVCHAGNQVDEEATQYYTIRKCLVRQNLAANSLGLQLNNLEESDFYIYANNTTTGTAEEKEAYIEFATYTAPDSVTISARVNGVFIPIFQVCNISTYSDSDPTNGTYRPRSDTILQFVVKIPKGTTKLHFDYNGADTPTYLGMWNLNDFSQGVASAQPFGSSNSKYRVVQGPLANYNDIQTPRTDANNKICID